MVEDWIVKETMMSQHTCDWDWIALLFVLLILVVLFAGEPDFHDLLVSYIGSKI